MLSIEDCVALSELSEDEVRAIAEHEHIPEIVAAEMGNYLVHTPDGEVRVRAILVDDLCTARDCGNTERVLALKMILKHYLGEHPVAERRQTPRG
jgi:hypothetical protein